MQAGQASKRAQQAAAGAVGSVKYAESMVTDAEKHLQRVKKKLAKAERNFQAANATRIHLSLRVGRLLRGKQDTDAAAAKASSARFTAKQNHESSDTAWKSADKKYRLAVAQDTGGPGVTEQKQRAAVTKAAMNRARKVLDDAIRLNKSEHERKASAKLKYEKAVEAESAARKKMGLLKVDLPGLKVSIENAKRKLTAAKLSLGQAKQKASAVESKVQAAKDKAKRANAISERDQAALQRTTASNVPSTRDVMAADYEDLDYDGD